MENAVLAVDSILIILLIIITIITLILVLEEVDQILADRSITVVIDRM